MAADDVADDDGPTLDDRPASPWSRRADTVWSAAPPPGRPATDALLVAAGGGDVEAFAVFYDMTAPLVVGMVHGVTGRSDDTERLSEHVYLALWRGAPGFDPAVRSADATLLLVARRALIGPVRRLVGTPHTPSSTRTADRPGRDQAG